MRSVLKRVEFRVRRLLKQPVPHFKDYLPYLIGKAGIEIGGPSSTFSAPDALPIYDQVGTLDNCDFSSNTVWAEHHPEFVCCIGKPPGKSFFCEGSHLAPIPDATYDFVLSCHNLEHFANPIKALVEWKRVLRPGGALILVLPYFVNTFDHRRTPTTIEHLWGDFNNNVGEDDLTHVPDLLEKHDLSRDPAAGSFESFTQRCLDNLNNRCIHHHVFDEHNSKEMLISVGFKVIRADAMGSVYLLARKPHDPNRPPAPRPQRIDARV